MKGDNIKNLKISLSKMDWNSVLENENPSKQFEAFHTILMDELDKHCPEKRHTIPDKFIFKEPWITKGLLKCLEKQKKYYTKFLKMKTIENESKYKVYRNILQSVLRKAK